MEEVLQDATTSQSSAIIGAPFVLTLNHLGPAGLPLAGALTRAGQLPEWRIGTVPFPSDPQTLLPVGATVVVNVKDGRHAHTAAEGPGYVLYLCTGNTSTRIYVAARTGERAERLLESIKARIEQPPSHTVPFTLWRWASGEASSWHRDLEVPAWADVARNYPGRAELDALMALSSVAGTGRLMLWTGAPGTGKTNAIRALARAWSPWCSAHLIVDPERFFGDAAYLIEVMSQEQYDDDEEDAPKARLIICEDADDFIQARHTSGAGVGRLLNVADGILGQGLNNIVLLTSNTPVAQLDPALLRPGRLLANVEFGRFTGEEARAWLGNGAAVGSSTGYTLAELYEKAGMVARHVGSPVEPSGAGPYL